MRWFTGKRIFYHSLVRPFFAIFFSLTFTKDHKGTTCFWPISIVAFEAYGLWTMFWLSNMQKCSSCLASRPFCSECLQVLNLSDWLQALQLKSLEIESRANRDAGHIVAQTTRKWQMALRNKKLWDFERSNHTDKRRSACTNKPLWEHRQAYQWCSTIWFTPKRPTGLWLSTPHKPQRSD